MAPPGGSGGGRDPWSGSTDPGAELEVLIREGQQRLKQIMPGGGPRGAIALAVLALVGLGGWTGLYTVPSDSVAVVQRFGKFLKDVPPGLHIKLPFGIDAATIVPVKRQLKQEFGFTTPGASDQGQRPTRPTVRDGMRETQMVTGDLNAALVEWVVQYRIAEPAKFPSRASRTEMLVRGISVAGSRNSIRR